MEIARIEGNGITDRRRMSLDDVPPHKRANWLPIEGEPPACDHRIETMSGPTYTIEPTRVLRAWAVTRRSLAEQQQAVKAECQRRIIALTGTTDLIACVIKQSNANMRANELNDKRIAGQVLTAGEEAEATALRNLALAIKALRARSNEIEALVPIPADFDADARWGA